MNNDSHVSWLFVWTCLRGDEMLSVFCVKAWRRSRLHSLHMFRWLPGVGVGRGPHQMCCLDSLTTRWRHTGTINWDLRPGVKHGYEYPAQISALQEVRVRVTRIGGSLLLVSSGQKQPLIGRTCYSYFLKRETRHWQSSETGAPGVSLTAGDQCWEC